MPYSHHSHSGSFCKHAHDTLESVIKTAIDKQFRIFSLTEHVPRLDQKYLYPEEEELDMTPETLRDQFERYIETARKLQSEINTQNSKIKLLVGFESEGGINDEHLKMCLELRKQMDADLVVGSVHHVNGTDIDFDQKSWNQAADECDGIRGLYRSYFQLVNNMIVTLKPEVVAHFDLIRLYSTTEIEMENVQDGKLETQVVKITQEEKLGVSIEHDWPEVWAIIEDCLQLIVDYDLTVELNSSAIRKGWNTPYPKDDIMRLMVSRGVKFVLSDDSHGDDQVGLNYQFVLSYIQKMGVKTIWYYDLEDFNNVQVRNGRGNVVLRPIDVSDLVKDEFWMVNYPSLFK